MKRFAALLSLVLLGCPKETPKETPSDASAPPAPSASSSAAAVDGGAADKAGTASTWNVKYTLTAGTMHSPESKGFKNDETKYLGDGTLTLNVDPSGKVTGTSEGEPLGSALIDGQLEGDTLNGMVRRKEPGDYGLVGTLTSTVKGKELEGEMHLSEGNAAVVRLGKITGTKK